MVPDLNCEVQDRLLEVVDLKQEVPDLRSGVIPLPQFNPWPSQTSLSGQPAQMAIICLVPFRHNVKYKTWPSGHSAMWILTISSCRV